MKKGREAGTGGFFMTRPYQSGKLVDLAAFRREPGGKAADGDAWSGGLLWDRERRGEDGPAPQRRGRFPGERGFWLLDACASAGIVVMALAFVIRAFTI